MNSDKQTLILAGEQPPRRGVTESSPRGFAYAAAPLRRPLTLVATPIDDPLLLAQGADEVIQPLVASQRFADRGSSCDAANAYAQTQQLSASTRPAIIDTYA